MSDMRGFSACEDRRRSESRTVGSCSEAGLTRVRTRGSAAEGQLRVGQVDSEPLASK